MNIKLDTQTLTAVLDTAEKLTQKAERFAESYQTVAEATEDVIAEVANAIERVAPKPTTNNTNVTQHFAGGGTATTEGFEANSEAAIRKQIAVAVTKRQVVSFSYPVGRDQEFPTKVRRVVPTSVLSESFAGIDLDVEVSGQEPTRQFRFDRIQGTVRVDG